MKVAFVSHSAKPSGVELALIRLLKGFAKVSPTLIVLDQGEVLELARRAGLHAISLPLTGAGNVSRKATPLARAAMIPVLMIKSLELKRTLYEHDVQIVVSVSIKAALACWAATIGTRIKHVWWVRDHFTRAYLGPVNGRLARICVRWIPDAIMANSESTYEALRRPPKSVLICPPTVDLDQYPTRPIRESRDIHVAMVGRISEWKGQHIFVEAIRQLAARQGVHFSIVGAPLFGEHEYYKKLVAQISDADLEHLIKMRGHISDVPAVLAETDVLVHCSVLPEPFGAVVIEGMAAGCTVIASGEGGPAETIHDRADGLLSRPRDPQSLASLLGEVIRDESLRCHLSSNARTTVKSYSTRRIAPRVEVWLESVLSGALPKYASVLSGNFLSASDRREG